jgi:hypothetical protein
MLHSKDSRGRGRMMGGFTTPCAIRYDVLKNLVARVNDVIGLHGESFFKCVMTT